MVDNTERGISILMVEDNPGDVFMVREALEAAGFPHSLRVAQEGDEMMEALRDNGSNGGPHFDLVIMDLNLPGRSGRQLMSEMQADPVLRRLPVAVLSTSHFECEIGKEFPGLRSTFAAKTPDFQELVDIMNRFRQFARS